MLRPRKPVLSYRLHKSSGQAVMTLPLGGGRRKDVLLGPHGSPESKAEYARVISEWEVSGRRLPLPAGSHADLTISELLLAFFRHTDHYYHDRDGQPTKEVRCLRDALRPVRELYGHTLAIVFGSLALMAVRRSIVDAWLARTVCNARTNRIRLAFKWAESEELIPFADY